jgi:hypothetical protein
MSTTSRFEKSYKSIIVIYEALLNGKRCAVALNETYADKYCDQFYSVTNAKIELTKTGNGIYSIKLK